eukprot:361905-Chlamydomonas_euryale.AAC.2
MRPDPPSALGGCGGACVGLLPLLAGAPPGRISPPRLMPMSAALPDDRRAALDASEMLVAVTSIVAPAAEAAGMPAGAAGDGGCAALTAAT